MQAFVAATLRTINTLAQLGLLLACGLFAVERGAALSEGVIADLRGQANRPLCNVRSVAAPTPVLAARPASPPRLDPVRIPVARPSHLRISTGTMGYAGR